MRTGHKPLRTDRIEIEESRISDLKPARRNARTHSRQQIRQIAESIREFGFANPILIDEANNLIAGHGRLEAARLLGLSKVPTIRLGYLSDVQKRALAIADNKIALNAGRNESLLAQELQFLSEVEIDFDVSITGFPAPEIDVLIDALEPERADEEIEQLPKPPGPSHVCVRRGDLWYLGRHRLLCGDATQGSDFDRLMAGERAQMVITDPPYNVPIDGHVCGLGRIRHREFAMASGEMSEETFARFLETVFRSLTRHSHGGSIHYIFMDWRHCHELLTAGRKVYGELKNICVWAKTNGGMGSLYRSRHELVFVYKNGRAPHINNVELGKHGRNRSNVWTYAGVNTFGAGRDKLQLHPTVKPVALVADAMVDCSTRGGLVLDVFAGSGTTILAAERTGRRAYTMEIDPAYVEVAIDRWQKLTGKTARHGEAGCSLEELRQRRQHKNRGKRRRKMRKRTACSDRGLPAETSHGR